MAAIEVTTQAQLDKAVKNLKPSDWIVCLGGTRYRPLTVRGSSHVVARESSHVEAWGSSHVVARESSHVVAWGSSHVVAWGSSHVEAWESSHVVASPFVAVTKQPSHRGKLAGGVIIEIPEVTTPQEWVDFHGLAVTRGLVTLYKAVDDEFKSGYGFTYAPGTKPKCDDWNTRAECGGGLHLTAHPLISKDYMQNATRYLACPVKVAELVVIDNEKVKAPRIAGAVYEVTQDRERVETKAAA